MNFKGFLNWFLKGNKSILCKVEHHTKLDILPRAPYAPAMSNTYLYFRLKYHMVDSLNFCMNSIVNKLSYLGSISCPHRWYMFNRYVCTPINRLGDFMTKM